MTMSSGPVNYPPRGSGSPVLRGRLEASPDYSRDAWQLVLSSAVSQGWVGQALVQNDDVAFMVVNINDVSNTEARLIPCKKPVKFETC